MKSYLTENRLLISLLILNEFRWISLTSIASDTIRKPMLFLMFSGRIYLPNSFTFAKYYNRYYETIPNFVTDQVNKSSPFWEYFRYLFWVVVARTKYLSTKKRMANVWDRSIFTSGYSRSLYVPVNKKRVDLADVILLLR